jgi:hypothetical protein
MLRFLWLVGFSLWTGGFVFYASFVVPILRHELGESAIITRHVAPIFNWVGVFVLAFWFFELWVERPRPKNWRLGFGLLIANAFLLGALFWAYEWVKSGSQDPSDAAFWLSHRIYLWLSTIQFLLSVASLAVALRRWRQADVQTSMAVSQRTPDWRESNATHAKGVQDSSPG